jgi:aryl-alcohol dehydrogenase-like predicted oxidoreductase
MLARDLAQAFPTVTLDTDALDAARTLAEHRLPGLLVVDERGAPCTVLPGARCCASWCRHTCRTIRRADPLGRHPARVEPIEHGYTTRSGGHPQPAGVVAMEKRRLGRLGHQSSVLIYGAAALGDVPQDEADRSIDEAVEGGINHFDVAADYGDAELRLGPWMSDLRDRIFLATKTGQRERESAWREIHASLQRLQTDHVDLLQLHAVGDLHELERATGPDGALEAAIRAREEGLVGAIGITGHGHEAPATHLEALRRYDFDTVLTPLNPVLWRDEVYRADYLALVAEVQRRDVGLMTIKTVSRRNWPDEAGRGFSTWYEPYADQARVTAAVSWVLSRSEVTGIPTAGDVRLLPLLLAAEQNRETPTEADRRLATDPEYSSPFVAMPF